MTEEEIKYHQDNWYRLNAPLGIELGYPDCCIKAFCDMPPAMLKEHKITKDDRNRYDAGCINGQFTGFIPCSHHANQILAGEITLESLIQNRSESFPAFPNYALRKKKKQEAKDDLFLIAAAALFVGSGIYLLSKFFSKAKAEAAITDLTPID